MYKKIIIIKDGFYSRDIEDIEYTIDKMIKEIENENENIKILVTIEKIQNYE